jgi:hypothetical protein
MMFPGRSAPYRFLPVLLIAGIFLLGACSLVYQLGYSNGFSQGLLAGVNTGTGSTASVYPGYPYGGYGIGPHFSFFPLFGLLLFGLFLFFIFRHLFFQRGWGGYSRHWRPGQPQDHDPSHGPGSGPDNPEADRSWYT